MENVKYVNDGREKRISNGPSFLRVVKGGRTYNVLCPSSKKQDKDTVGCGGGSIKAIFQSKKLKFDMVLYFGLINCPTVAKKFSCKNGF